MTQNNYIYVIKSGLSYRDSMYLVDKLLSQAQHVCLFLHKNNMYYDIYNKIKDSIHKQYPGFIKEKQLIIQEYEDDTQSTSDLVMTNSLLMTFEKYVLLNPKNYYTSTFIDFIETNIDVTESICQISPNQCIDHKLRLCVNKCVSDIIVSKTYLMDHVNENFYKKPNINIKKTSAVIPFENHGESFDLCKQPSFVLAYLQETKDSKLTDSYCFIYRRNDRVMNIDNEITGDLFAIDEEQLIIIWNFEDEEKVQCVYKLDSESVYLLAESIPL